MSDTKCYEYEVDCEDYAGMDAEKVYLTDRGSDGWELVTVLADNAYKAIYYWKREVFAVGVVTYE